MVASIWIGVSWFRFRRETPRSCQRHFSQKRRGRSRVDHLTSDPPEFRTFLSESPRKRIPSLAGSTGAEVWRAVAGHSSKPRESLIFHVDEGPGRPVLNRVTSSCDDSYASDQRVGSQP